MSFAYLFKKKSPENTVKSTNTDMTKDILRSSIPLWRILLPDIIHYFISKVVKTCISVEVYDQMNTLGPLY